MKPITHLNPILSNGCSEKNPARLATLRALPNYTRCIYCIVTALPNQVSIYSGTAAINPKKKVPQLNNIESNFKNQLEGLYSEIKELKSFLIEKSDDKFKALLKEINLSRNN